MLAALFRQLDAFAEEGAHGTDAPEALRVPELEGLGDAYEGRRQRSRRGIARAVQSAEFLSDLAEGLAGVNMYESDPCAPKRLVAAAGRLGEIAEEAEQPAKRVRHED